MMLITRVCGRPLSYAAVSSSWSPWLTGIPEGETVRLIEIGDGSCSIGRTR